MTLSEMCHNADDNSDTPLDDKRLYHCRLIHGIGNYISIFLESFNTCEASVAS